MSLATEWAARTSTTRQIQLSNPDEVGATTVDTTRRDAAIADVTASFITYAGDVFDDTDAQHIQVAVPGVSAYLESYGSKSPATAGAQLEDFHRSLTDMAKSRNRHRLLPTTSVTASPTDPSVTGVTERPSFDDPKFDGLVADGRTAGDDG